MSSRDKTMPERGRRFHEIPDEGVSVATLQREFEIAERRFPVVYGDEQFAKPGTLPDPVALDWAFKMIKKRNPNLVEPSMFKGAWEIEREAISMLAQMFHHPDYSRKGFDPEKEAVLGWFTDGGTTSILQAAWSFRNRYFRTLEANSGGEFNPNKDLGAIREEGLFGLINRNLVNPNKPPVILAPVDLHFAGDKSIDVLGLGTNNILRYNLNPDFTTDYNSLERQIQELARTGRDVMFAFALAGATNTGRVEDVSELEAALRRSGSEAPIIVDAAQQFMMLALLEEQYPEWDFRVEGVEAIIADPHKTDASTYPGGTILFRDRNIALDTTSTPGYLHSADDREFEMKKGWGMYPSFHTSRSPIGAISTWVHFALQGRKKLKEKYQKMYDLTGTIAQYVRDSDFFELVMEPQTGVVALQVKDGDDNKSKRMYEMFDDCTEIPRFYICYADNIRVRTREDQTKYNAQKRLSKGQPITAGFGGLYIQVMQHATPDLIEQLTKRLDRFGREVMKGK